MCALTRAPVASTVDLHMKISTAIPGQKHNKLEISVPFRGFCLSNQVELTPFAHVSQYPPSCPRSKFQGSCRYGCSTLGARQAWCKSEAPRLCCECQGLAHAHVGMGFEAGVSSLEGPGYAMLLA